MKSSTVHNSDLTPRYALLGVNLSYGCVISERRKVKGSVYNLYPKHKHLCIANAPIVTSQTEHSRYLNKVAKWAGKASNTYISLLSNLYISSVSAADKTGSSAEEQAGWTVDSGD